MPVSKLASLGCECLGSGLPGGGAKDTSMAQQFTRSAMRPVCFGAGESHVLLFFGRTALPAGAHSRLSPTCETSRRVEWDTDVGDVRSTGCRRVSMQARL